MYRAPEIMRKCDSLHSDQYIFHSIHIFNDDYFTYMAAFAFKTRKLTIYYSNFEYVH